MIGNPKYAPPQAPLVVLHEDDDLLILDKPSGLLSVPGKSPDLADCLEARARAYCPGVSIVHRLDRDTSGVIALAKHRTAHRHLGLQFERRHVAKRYISVVLGRMRAERGRIDAPLVCDWPNRPMQKICAETGRAALTDWQVLERHKDTTRLMLWPLTGRAHQLRVHLLSLGHPILGDVIYAPPQAAAARLHLHAEELTLRHPSGGRPHSFRAACPF